MRSVTSIIIPARKNSSCAVFTKQHWRHSRLSNVHTNFKLDGGGEFLALVAPDATAEQAGVEIDEISRRLHVEYPDAYDRSQGYSISVTPLREQLASRTAATAPFISAIAPAACARART